MSPSFAKSAAPTAATPTVTTANPSYGYEGEVAKHVKITGSNFAPGAQAAWERGGVADSKIQVLSTSYVSSTELDATITIAGDAVIDLYDISVTNKDRKKGIGYSLFQVTQAVAVTGTTILRGTNSTGELVGVLIGSGNSQNTAVYFSVGSASLIPLSTSGAAWAIDEAGTTITGNTNGGNSLPIPIWNRIGGTWVSSALPVGPTTAGGNGRTIASDPVTGVVSYVGGLEHTACKKTCGDEAVIWRLGLAGWQRVALPSLGSGQIYVEAVSAGGVAVGASAGHAVVWAPDGSGGYSVSALPGLSTVAHGITSAGDVIVGGHNATSNSASFWTRLPGGGWSAAQSLSIPCGDAVDIDDAGRIVANFCPKNSRVTLPAVFSPPYATAAPFWLGGLQPTSGATVEAISRRNGWIVGQAGSTGVYWTIP